MQVALSGPSVTDRCCSILLFSAQCTPALGGLRSAMESWKVVGGQGKTTKAAGQGLRPKPSVGLLGALNREQGERSGGEAPKNGATRQVHQRGFLLGSSDCLTSERVYRDRE